MKVLKFCTSKGALIKLKSNNTLRKYLPHDYQLTSLMCIEHCQVDEINKKEMKTKVNRNKGNEHTVHKRKNTNGT